MSILLRIHDKPYSAFKTLSVISRNCGISPLIRIPENNYNFIARSLDLGSHGIMNPMVNDEKQTKKILEFSKYPPIGKRGAGFGFAHNDYHDKDDPLEIISFANDNLINIIQIETKKGLENVEKISKIKGVDCLWVGHFDLTNFLGVPGQFSSKPFLDAINKIVSVAKQNNKSLGIMVKEKKEMNFYEDLGFNVIAVGTEMSLLTNAIKRIIC